ncbi:MAG: chromate efflux transporter [Cyclobacteriaceae bacterium]
MNTTLTYPRFLRDVFILSISTFGGPQSHIAYFQRLLVERRKYITEAELIEVNSLGQVLPGPTSTQTLTAVAFKLRGPSLAYLTLLVWMLPAVGIMTAAALLVSHLEASNTSMSFTRFIQPMAVGLVAHAAYTIIRRTVHTRTGVVLLVLAALASYFIRSPYIFPAILLLAGAVTSFKYKAQPREQKRPVGMRWENLLLWIGVLIFAAVLGGLTKSIPWALPIRLFENFYRNGSLVFGGGQVLTPMLYTEFVQYAPKQYLSPTEFLSGYALAQSVPGPVFSFSAYIGTLAMRDIGLWGQLWGALMSAAGIFLPGTFLMFFMMRVWESLKAYRPIRASLEGINAANAGLVASAAVVLFLPLEHSASNALLVLGTFGLMTFTKIPSWGIIVAGLVLGLVL